MMGYILCHGGVVSNCLMAVKLLPTGGRGGNNNYYYIYLDGDLVEESAYFGQGQIVYEVSGLSEDI